MNRASKLLIGLNLILAITISAILIYVGSSVHEALTNEVLTCEVQSLEKHGFSQVSEKYPEYVCVNPGNYTDFVIIEDHGDGYELGTLLNVTISADNSVVRVGVVQ